MDVPTMIGIRSGAADTTSLVSYFPIPFYGILPVNAFLIRASQPVLVDTGLGALRDPFMNNLRTLIDLRDLRWLWLDSHRCRSHGQPAADPRRGAQRAGRDNFPGHGQDGAAATAPGPRFTCSTPARGSMSATGNCCA